MKFINIVFKKIKDGLQFVEIENDDGKSISVGGYVERPDGLTAIRVKYNSCLHKSADDEPVFVLCARDPAAPEIVREWADAYASRKEEGGGTMNETERAKYRDAIGVAAQMTAWQKENGVKPWA